MGWLDKKTKPKPDFTNVQSGGSSTARPPATSQSPVPSSESVDTYVVQKGDSLWKISERFYGKGNEWNRIFEANRDTIKDPDLIHPGQRLRIPNSPKI